jgi:uncharacterized protein (TIGR03382 family)
MSGAADPSQPQPAMARGCSTSSFPGAHLGTVFLLGLLILAVRRYCRRG